MAIDSAGYTLVVDSQQNVVQRFNANGTYSGGFGAGFVSYSSLHAPQGIAVDPAGNMYVADTGGNRVQKFNSGGAYLSTIGVFGVWGSDNDHLASPFGVATDAGGNIYVCDTFNQRVQKFSASGAYLATLGVSDEPGGDNAHFYKPWSAAVDGAGRLYIVDSANARVQVFGADGAYLRTLGVSGVPGSDNDHFCSPEGVTVDAAGLVYVADTGNHRVQIFDAGGAYLGTLGVTGVLGTDNGHFSSPQGVAVDALGNLYVADTGNGRVQVFATARYVYRYRGGNFDPSQSLGTLYSGANYAAFTIASTVPLPQACNALGCDTGKFTIIGGNGIDNDYNLISSVSITGFDVNGLPNSWNIIMKKYLPGVSGSQYVASYNETTTDGRIFVNDVLGHPDDNGVMVDMIEASFQTTTPSSFWSRDAVVPAAPSVSQVTVSNGMAVVTIAPPSFDGGNPVTGYTVTTVPAGGIDQNAGSTSLTHVVTGLAGGTSYSFTVTAANAVGSSASSTAVSPPPAPTMLYTFTGTASGSVNGTSFNNARFTISTAGNPASVGFNQASGTYFLDATSTISVGGIGSGVVVPTTPGTMVGVAINYDIVNFHLHPNPGSLFKLEEGALMGWDLKSPIGPVSGNLSLGGISDLPTTMGAVTITSMSDVTFSAVPIVAADRDHESDVAGSYDAKSTAGSELADVSIGYHTVQLSASGALQGTQTFNANRIITFTSGSYQGWGARWGTYQLGDLKGTLYIVTSPTKWWGSYFGDINGVYTRDLATGKSQLQLTSIRGVRASGVVDLTGAVVTDPGVTTTLTGQQVNVYVATQTEQATGFYSGKITRNVKTVRLNGSLRDGFTTGTYQSDWGSGSFVHYSMNGQSATSGFGMIDGPLFGTWMESHVVPTAAGSPITAHLDMATPANISTLVQPAHTGAAQVTENADLTLNQGSTSQFTVSGLVNGSSTLATSREVVIGSGEFTGWRLSVGSYRLGDYNGTSYTVESPTASRATWIGDINGTMTFERSKGTGRLLVSSIRGSNSSGVIDFRYTGQTPGQSTFFQGSPLIVRGTQSPLLLSGRLQGTANGSFAESYRLVLLGDPAVGQDGFLVGTYTLDQQGGEVSGYVTGLDPVVGIAGATGQSCQYEIVTGPATGALNACLTLPLSPSAVYSATFHPVTVVQPDAPSIGQVTVSGYTATVTITAPSNDGGSPITGYTVATVPAGGIDLDAGSASLTHTVVGVSGSASFTVTATNAAGTSAASAPSYAAQSGYVYTLAGQNIGDHGPAVSAHLAAPSGAKGIVKDALGNLYVSDSIHNVVRKVDPSGIITTFAGNGTWGYSGDGGPAANANLSQPQGLALDGAGNLYIIDANNYRIRKVSASGVITTVAGNGLNASTGDGGPAIYASLSNPRDIAVDAAGNLYIVEYSRVRRVDSGGTITTVAGGGNYTANLGDGGPATGAYFGSAYGVAFHGNSMFVADASRIWKVDLTTQIISAFATGVNCPSSLRSDAAGNLYASQSCTSQVMRFDAATAAPTLIAGNNMIGFSGDGGPATSASLSFPYDLTVDGAGNVYIFDSGNRRVRMVSPSGTISTVVGDGGAGDGGPATSASLSDPSGIIVDDAGVVYFADGNNGRVRRIDPATGIITTVAGNGVTNQVYGDGGPAVNAAIGNATDLAFDRNGNLYIASSNRVRKVEAATGIITTVAGGGSYTPNRGDGGPATGATLFASAIAFDSAGNLFIGDNSYHQIRRVDAATGIITTYAGTGVNGFSGDGGPATAATLSRPWSIKVDSHDNLYIGDLDAGRVRKIDPATGIITTVAGNGGSGASGDGGPALQAVIGVRGVAIDSQDNIFVVSGGGNSLAPKLARRIDAVTGIVTTVAGTGANGFSGDGGPALNATFSRIRGIAVDRQGNLYLSDAGNGRIRKVVASAVDNQAPLVSANPPGGTYVSAQQVTLSADKGATIYYTTDGSDPTTSATRKSLNTSGQVSIASSTALRYYAVSPANPASAVAVQNYDITYQQAANPAYQSSQVFSSSNQSSITETAQVTVTTGRTITLSGYGALPGPNTMTITRSVAIGSGQWAGWSYGTGTYNFSGKQGIVYVLKHDNRIWETLVGDLHAVSIMEGPGHSSRRLYVTSMDGAATPGEYQLFTTAGSPGSMVSLPAVPVTTTNRSATVALSGYDNETLTLGSPLVTTTIDGVTDGFAAGSYHTASGQPGYEVTYWGSGTVAGVFTGPVFALFNATTMEHVLATAPTIAAGGSHGEAVKTDGSLWSWGNNTYGAQATTDPEPVTPHSVLSGMTGVAAGAKHVLAVTRTGSLLAWGEGSTGDLGNGVAVSSFAPVTVQTPAGSFFTKVAAGHGYSLALDISGNVWSWGTNYNGELGLGMVSGAYSAPQPVAIPGGTPVVAASAGDAHVLALLENGTVMGWGSNGSGQLTLDRSITTVSAPAPVLLPGRADAVAAGGYHSLALMPDGSVSAWGSNSHGQLGDGSTQDEVLPVTVSGLSQVVAIAAGNDHSLALKRDGTVWAWGAGYRGQLGNDDPRKLDSAVPVQVRNIDGSALTGVIAIAAGDGFSLALRSDGSVIGWGANNTRQLGVHNTSDFIYPTTPRVNVTDLVPPTVTATPAGGSFTSPVTVTLSYSGAANNIIFYTTDGSDPWLPTHKAAPNASQVQVPVSSTTTLRFFATDGGGNMSRPQSLVYTFDNAPAISGSPLTSAISGVIYSFTPAGSVSSGTITYSIANKPSWASFNSATGTLSGTPAAANVGTYGNIVISATANGLTASLAPFSITVTGTLVNSATTFVVVNGGAATTGSSAVTLSLGCSLGEKCAQMQFSNDNLVWSAPEPFATTKSWMLPAGDGLKTVYVNFLDANGVPGNTYFNNVVLTGTTQPSGSYLFDQKWGGADQGDGSFFLPALIAWSKSDGAIYVGDAGNCRIEKFDENLKFAGKWGGCGSGDGQFISMRGLATDSHGNVFVADIGNRVQKFAPDGAFVARWSGVGSQINDIAIDRDDIVYLSGGGLVQRFDDNGSFIDQWAVPYQGTGLAVDSLKSVYVRSGGQVYQYNDGALIGSWPIPYSYNVSGQATFSGFGFDEATGTLAIADASAHTIRFYSLPSSETGAGAAQVATWGSYGAGDGQLKRPQSVAFDASGNMYIADTGNERLIKVAGPSFAATPSATVGRILADGMNLPVSVAVSPADGTLLVTDQQNDRVVRYSTSGALLQSWGGSGSAAGQFATPLDAVADGAGNLFVLDGGNNRVQKIAMATGQVTAVFGAAGDAAGDPAGILSNPRRLALDRNGNLYVGQPGQITKFDGNGRFVARIANLVADLNQYVSMGSIAIDSRSQGSDILYVMDTGFRRVLKFDAAGNYLGVVANQQLGTMSAIAVDNSGYLYVYENNTGMINKFDPLGNLVTNWGNKSAVLDGSMRNAQGLAVGPHGTVYVADTGNNRIEAFLPASIPNGTATINAGAATTVGNVVNLSLFGQTNAGSLTAMRFSNDDRNWSAWEPYATTKAGWQLAGTSGVNYVYIQFKNSLGIISSTVKASITVQPQLFTAVTAPAESTASVSVTPTADASMNVTFQSVVATSGTAGVRVTAAVTPPPPPQNVTVYNSQVYEIQAPGVSFAGTAEVCLAFRPSAVANPNNMKIMHFDSAVASWVDITTRVLFDAANDTGKVCGNTPSFSPFMQVEALTPTDGACGSANGGTFTSMPESYLCSAGAASAVSGTGPWSWSCAGANGGSAAACQAAKLAYTAPPVTTATPAPGNYTGTSLLVTLATTNNAVIYYTTDGSTPTASSAVYSSPILINSGSAVTVKYFAKDSSNNSESVNSALYMVTSSSQPGGSWAGVKSGTSFTVFRSEGGNPYQTLLANRGSTSFTDTSSLKPNTIYRYAVSSDTDPTQTEFMTVHTPLYNGWNIVAVPYQTAGVNPAAFFATPVGSIYQWVPAGATAESSSTVLGSYRTVNGLTPGYGYFVKASTGSTLMTYSGQAGPASATVLLKPGWTMVADPNAATRSGIGSSWLVDGMPLADAISANLVGGSVYWWNGTTYDSWTVASDPVIEPWKGYWILNLDSVDHTLTIQ
ncbi:hypothetical protein GMSM_19340 [Geomonas sp. Red276]